MSRPPTVPRQLGFLPFRGSRAIAAGLLTGRMLRGPTWRRILPDVYVHADAFSAADHRMWCEAVALVLPDGAAVGGLSAAFLWGADLLPRDGPVEVMIPRPARMRSQPKVRANHTILASDDVVRFCGLPVTSPVRTAFDLGRRRPRVDALVAVDALAHRRVAKLPAIAGYAAARPGWPGVSQLRDLLDLAEPLAESPMETRLRLLLLDAGLPRPTAQHEVRDRRGHLIGRLDLAYPELRIGLEYEGDHHRERAHFQRDVVRLNALRAAGWLVLRFTADDVLRHQARVVGEVRRARDERGAAGSPPPSTPAGAG